MTQEILPRNFFTFGINSGIARNKNKLDLALFYSDSPCTASAMFTSNQVQSAPIIVSKQNLALSENNIRAVIANSGCANACTGKEGVFDANTVCNYTATMFGLKPEQVLVSSTGVIGTHLPMPMIKQGIEKLSMILNQSKTENKPKLSPFTSAQAIMTTDTFPKIVSKSFNLDNTTVHIWACAKGAGMIHPDLQLTESLSKNRDLNSAKKHATFLCFILTDLAIQKMLLDKALNDVVQLTFNCVTVDGDTSTNDTVFLLANGAAGNPMIIKKDKEYSLFYETLLSTTTDLAQMISRDGEGATKQIKIVIQNTANLNLARAAARVIATSPLVKTAIFGADPNWGRIMAALGRTKLNLNPDIVDIYINNILVVKNGLSANADFNELREVLNKKEVELKIDLHTGRYSITVYTCDLTYDYIKINASYTT